MHKTSIAYEYCARSPLTVSFRAVRFLIEDLRRHVAWGATHAVEPTPGLILVLPHMGQTKVCNLPSSIFVNEDVALQISRKNKADE